MTAPVLGQTVIVKIASSPVRVVPAIVSLVTDEDTVNAVGQIDIDDDWPANGPGDTHPGFAFFGITRGSGLNQWQDAPVPVTTEDAIAAALDGYATEAFVESEVAGAGYASESYVNNAQAACQALPGAGSTVSLALNTPRQPSTTRPVRVSVSGDWSWNLTAIGTQSGTLTLASDSASSPSTARARATCSRSVGVGVVVSDAGTMPIFVSYEVPIGHYYTIATTGTGTFGASPLVTEQVL